MLTRSSPPQVKSSVNATSVDSGATPKIGTRDSHACERKYAHACSAPGASIFTIIAKGRATSRAFAASSQRPTIATGKPAEPAASAIRRVAASPNGPTINTTRASSAPMIRCPPGPLVSFQCT